VEKDAAVSGGLTLRGEKGGAGADGVFSGGGPHGGNLPKVGDYLTEGGLSPVQ